MKRLLYLFAAMFLTAVVGTFAQDRASENAQVSARIIASLSIAKNQDLDFGKVAQGVGVVAIAPENTKAVKFTISGEPSENIKVTYTAPANLLAGSNTLPFTANVKSNTSDATAGASGLTSGATLALNTDGKAFVYLGGSINVAASQARGNYTGTFSIQVEY